MPSAVCGWNENLHRRSTVLLRSRVALMGVTGARTCCASTQVNSGINN